jgi:hypothetical protein
MSLRTSSKAAARQHRRIHLALANHRRLVVGKLNAPMSRDRVESFIMKKVEEYLRHAAECRDMARTVPPDYHQQLEQMARAWERLAQARKDQLDSWNKRTDSRFRTSSR